MNIKLHGDGREKRQQAETLYNSAKDFLELGRVRSNPALSAQIKSLSDEDRATFFENRIHVIGSVEHYSPHARKLEQLVANQNERALYDPESINGITLIAGAIYAKSPEALQEVMTYLQDRGYSIKSTESSRTPDRKTMEKNGHSLWFATISDDVVERAAECGSCEEIMPVNGAARHGTLCPHCGDMTQEEYRDGGVIRFSVVRERDASFFQDPTMFIRSYDTEAEELHLYVNPDDCIEKLANPKTYLGLSPEESTAKAHEYVKRFPDAFSFTEQDGIQLLTIKHKNDFYVHENGINTSEILGQKRNHRMVKLYDGKVLGEYERIPIPETINMYEAWHWSPLEPGAGLYERIMNAAGQVSRKDYYYQDGRAAFHDISVNNMLKFIDQFTTVDVDTVRPHISADLSGPAMIDTLASLTGHTDHIRTEPNIMNALNLTVKMSQALHGQPVDLTEEEIAAGTEALADDMKGEDFIRKSIRRLRR